MNTKRITIHFPESNFDGTQWVDVCREKSSKGYDKLTFQFITGVEPDESEWGILVKTAKAILAQDQREKSKTLLPEQRDFLNQEFGGYDLDDQNQVLIYISTSCQLIYEINVMFPNGSLEEVENSGSTFYTGVYVK